MANSEAEKIRVRIQKAKTYIRKYATKEDLESAKEILLKKKEKYNG